MASIAVVTAHPGVFVRRSSADCNLAKGDR
jgi:hypothetical protein